MKGGSGAMGWDESYSMPSAPPPPDALASISAPSAPPAPQQQPQQHQQGGMAGATNKPPQYPAMLPVSSSTPFASPTTTVTPPPPAATTNRPLTQPEPAANPGAVHSQWPGNPTSIIVPPPGLHNWPESDRYSGAPAAASAAFGGDEAAGHSTYEYGAFAPAQGFGDDSEAPLLGPSYTQNDLLYANRQVRHGFLRKVLGLLTVQLLLTAAIGGAIAFNKAAHDYMNTNLWVLWLATVLSFTVLIVLACSEDARRRHPTNLLLLLVFTAAEGVLVGAATASFDTNVVLMAFAVTAVVTLALLVYAVQTSVDFTVTGGILYSALVITLVVSMANLFFHWRALDLLISGCGALLFSAYLVFDVQLVASGEHSFQIGADEYVYAALNIYIDVIGLFLHILRIIQQLQGNDDAD